MRGMFVFLTIGLIFFLQAKSYSRDEKIFVYHRLATKGVEEMDRLVKRKIQASRSDETLRLSHLVEATQALFCRPNYDNLIEKVLPQLMVELKDKDLTKPVFESFLKDALSAVKNEGGQVSPEAQVTYWIGLENWVKEMSLFLDQEEVRNLFSLLAQEKIKPTKEAQKESKIRIPYRLQNVTELAKSYLQKYEDKNKKPE